MKNILSSILLVGALGAGSAYASDLHSDTLISAGTSTVSETDLKHMRQCLYSDAQIASSRSIRACSKAIKASVPNYQIRSDLYARRGLLQLSAGRFDMASRDFETAARLNGEHEFAFLGQGFSALMQQQYAEAENFFSDCKGHDFTAPLASYGLAMTYELKGEKSRALQEYKNASALRPDWQTPHKEYARLSSRS